VVEVWLPYGTSEIPARVPDERLIGIIKPQTQTISDSAAKARSLLEANEGLQQAASNADNVCVVLGPCGNQQLAFSLIEAIQQNLHAKTSGRFFILVAPGAFEIDPNSFPETHVSYHQPESSPTLPIKEFAGGFSPELNADFLTADLKIVIGELNPQSFLQCSGLCDVVFPGLASTDSIKRHSVGRPGFATSDIRRERTEITNGVGDIFALGTVLNSDKTPVEVAFGKLPEALAALAPALEEVHVRNVKPADIVVTSSGGMPQDRSLLVAVEAFPPAISALKKNGALIVAAECGEGHGDTEFYDWSAEKKEAHHLEARLRHNFNYNGFKAAFLRRALATHRIYLVSTIPDHYVENVFGMKAAGTVNAAVQSAQRALGSDSTISVVPDASRLSIEPQSPAV
jgi:nickel-dependent lactate racemase